MVASMCIERGFAHDPFEYPDIFASRWILAPDTFFDVALRTLRYFVTTRRGC